MVRCVDNSLYCGVATDVSGRVNAHNTGKGAKYTRSRKPVELVWVRHQSSKSEALKLEIKIKKMTKSAKERVVRTGRLP